MPPEGLDYFTEPLLRETSGPIFLLTGGGPGVDGTYVVAADGDGIARISGKSLFTHLKGLTISPLDTPAAPARRNHRRKPPLTATVIRPASDLEIVEHLPGTVRALSARQAVLHGNFRPLNSFNRNVLGLRGSPRWQEAVSTALLGDWADTILTEGALAPEALARLRAEARSVHTQLVPLWERRTYGNKRVTLLEKPVQGGATLRDLLADRSPPDDPLFDQVPGDRRLGALLARLAPADQAVVLALGQPGVVTWADAAELAGSSQPDRDSKKTRRKVRAVLTELHRRDQQRTDGPTSLWTPTQNGGDQ